MGPVYGKDLSCCWCLPLHPVHLYHACSACVMNGFPDAACGLPHTVWRCVKHHSMLCAWMAALEVHQTPPLPLLVQHACALTVTRVPTIDASTVANTEPQAIITQQPSCCQSIIVRHLSYRMCV
eukprot:scaffold64264_cov19-Tisochrysis_lutea.AAC.1